MHKRERHHIEKQGARKAPLQPAASCVLQNMSCAPYHDISYHSPYRRPNCQGMIFALAPGRDLLPSLLEQPETANLSLTSPESAECALRQRIDAHALTLPFPAAALVTDRAEPEDVDCDDLMSIATVLAKSSGHVYLRDKTPNLNQIKPGRRVVLLISGGRRRK